MALFKAGWAKVEITPPLGHPMAGYARRSALSSGVLDPLFARALVLEVRRKRMAIVVADVLVLSNRWAQRLRQNIARALKVDERQVTVAATHTHSGPLVDAAPFDFAAEGSKSPSPSYVRRVERHMVLAVEQASARLAPVAASFARVRIRGVASDRNRPKRFRSQPMFLFKFTNVASTAIFGVYGCHSTVLGYSNTRFSGDLLGALARRLEEQDGFAVIACGAAANISTRFARKTQTPQELHRLAEILNSYANRARFRPLEVSPIGRKEGKVFLPFRRLEDARPAIVHATGRLVEAAEEAQINLEQLQRTLDFRREGAIVALTQLQLGRISFFALPFEIGLSTGEFLWRRAHAIPLCYANGYWGYVPPSSAASRDYEVISSPFPRHADQLLRRAALRLAPHP